jgi:hypothetical protein
MPIRHGRGAGGTSRKGHRVISRSTIAAATRVIQYAAARPIVLSPGLMPSSNAAAQGAEAGNADGVGAIAAQVPLNTGA